jgi:hypothetical protein
VKRASPKVPPATLDLIDQMEAELIDAIEEVFAACTHQFAINNEWCNLCGAMRTAPGMPWYRPHWRDLLVRALAK